MWLPASEQHLVEMLLSPDGQRVVGGKLTYQYRKLERAMLHVRERRHAVDIGAHVGLWSMHLAEMFSRVTAFEPNPVVAELWAWNVHAPTAVLHECALGKGDGTTGLLIHPGHSGHTRLEGPGDIPVRSLDSFDLADVDLIKIDVEGFELVVVKGAEQTIRRCRPVIVVEQKGEDGRLGMMLDGARKWLESIGMYSAECIGGDHVMVWA